MGQRGHGRRTPQVEAPAGLIEFPCVRGVQGGREFFTMSCDFATVVHRFQYDRMSGMSGVGAGRPRASRIPHITSYILGNREGFVLLPITVSVDAASRFTPAGGNVGTLSIPIHARMVVSEGRYRCAAIREACSTDESLYNERIAVILYVDRNLADYERMSGDMQRQGVPSTRSANILYDHQDTYARFLVTLAEDTPVFAGRTEMASSTLSNRTTKFVTLSGLEQATRLLLGAKTTRSLSGGAQGLASEYWRAVTDAIPQWGELVDGMIQAPDMRDAYVHSNTIGLSAIGLAGNAITSRPGWKRTVQKMSRIDWRRNNPDWEGTLVEKGRMLRTKVAIKKGAAQILARLEIPEEYHRQNARGRA